MSAYKEDMREKIRKINPEAQRIIEAMEELLREHGMSLGPMITEDMTKDEIIMTFIEERLKQGYSLEEAERLAEEDYLEWEEFEKKTEEILKEREMQITKKKNPEPIM